jgi:release factor glutamine methyltransferase
MQNQTRLRPNEWTIIKLIQWATTYFDAHGIDSPRTTAEILLSDVLNSRRIDLYLRYDQPLTTDELQRFKALIKRRLNHEPVAYILGRKEFWSMELCVTKDVLIPRPETECLVEKSLEILAADANVKSKLILELGTGCGAVILSLASENPQHTYWATDISINAIRIARQNALQHDLDGKIQFVTGDWFAPLGSKTGAFDLIVSNPPYIKSGDLTQLQPEIKAYEPLQALDGATDGLHCLQHIIHSAYRYLKPGGALILEIGHDQKSSLEKILDECGEYEGVRFYQDYSGYDRILQMNKKG